MEKNQKNFNREIFRLFGRTPPKCGSFQSSKNEEIERIKKEIIPILKEYKVTKAGIFGSYAKGQQNKKSDVDILIKIHNSAGLLTLISLKLELQKVIKRKVDLVEYETIRKELREQILNDEIRILQ